MYKLMPPQYYGFPGDVTPQFPQNRLLPTWRGCAPLGALPSGSYEGPVGKIAYSQNIQDLITLRNLGLGNLVFTGSNTLEGPLGAATRSSSGGSTSGGGKPGAAGTIVGGGAAWTPVSSGGGSYVKPNYQQTYSGQAAQPSTADDVFRYVEQGLHVAGTAVNLGFDIAGKVEARKEQASGAAEATEATSASDSGRRDSSRDSTSGQQQQQPQQQLMPSSPEGKDNTLLYVAIAIGAVALAGVAYVALKK